MTRPLVHVLTPGDHFSPRTGSAIPTVVDGLSTGAPAGGPRATVVVAAGTYPQRYPSADAVEYSPVPARPADRYVDVALARLGLPRAGVRRTLRAALAGQAAWSPAFVLAHNAPALVPLVDRRHVPVLYAHNQVLGTYGHGEARRTLAPAAAVVCVSDYLADQVRDSLPLELRARVRTVRNGVDLARFGGHRTPRVDRLRVVYVGRVISSKGVHVLLDAIGLLGRADVEVTIVGRAGFAHDAPLTRYERALRTRAADLRSPVHFASFVDRDALPRLLGRADVVVAPSVWPEPFGLTALEGMAAGAAVVASQVGGLPEAVGSAGMLVPPDDPAALAAVVEHLADDGGALDRAQRHAVEHARAQGWRHASQCLHALLTAEGADLPDRTGGPA
ncbi:glycosyltransferase family 4 protein [Isoptericola halotolerans]|uniref:glycosyltransferase family 4 protein n=1 Tax=Isoptericola halotolerans TaxID=300560 RepID=UPI00388D515A